MKKIIKILAINITFIVTVFLLSGCNSNPRSVSITTNDDNIVKQVEAQQKLNVLQAQKGDLLFPSWLKKLNIVEPKGLKLNISQSQKTTEKVEGFNSIHFVYNGDYDTSMKQAKLIAQKADIPVSKEFQMAQRILSSLNTGNNSKDQKDADNDLTNMLGDMKGIVYTNYNLMDKKSPNYTIAITVNEDGSLELDVTDMVAMKKITDEFIK